MGKNGEPGNAIPVPGGSGPESVPWIELKGARDIY